MGMAALTVACAMAHGWAEADSGRGPAIRTFAHQAMATVFEFQLLVSEADGTPDGLDAVVREAFAAVDDLERRISHWVDDSQTAYVNRHAAEGPVRVSPDLFDLIAYTKEVCRETGGAFDATVGPLLEAWGFDTKTYRVPDDTALAEAVACVGMDKVELNADERTVRFAMPGMRLDFGGIGKGLALDRAAEVLRQYGVDNGLLHSGTSTILAMGTGPNGAGWTVGIRDPYNRDAVLDEAVLKDESLSTSGSYERFFTIEGRTYGHIFDPRTGRPVEGMLSATAIAPTARESDALSTAFFVLGDAGTSAYCQRHPRVRAILVVEQADHGLEPKRINAGTQGNSHE